MQNPIDCTERDRRDWSLHFLDIKAELEDLDRQAGHEYLPMDVFVDSSTINEHFGDSSIHDRWTEIHGAAA